MGMEVLVLVLVLEEVLGADLGIRVVETLI
jgi:hypothetical protein